MNISGENDKAESWRKARNSLYLATGLAFVFLMILSKGLVFTFAHEPPSGKVLPFWLKSRQSRLYFLQAKEMVRPLIRAPIEKWSVQYLDDGTGCVEVGHGVWYATGTVDTRLKGSAGEQQTWDVFFVAETRTPIFCRVGDVQTGDPKQAMAMAHVRVPGAPGH